MKEYALTDLARKTSDVRHAATREPIVITERNAKRFVLMSYEDYERLSTRAQDPRRVLDMANLSADDAQILLEGLKSYLSGRADD